MKTLALSLLGSLSLTFTALATDSSVTFKQVHLCCDECVRGAQRSIKGIEGVSMTADKDAETVTLTGPSDAVLQKAANAMAAGGYFGVSDKSSIKPIAHNGTHGKNLQSMIVTGVHLCCGGCVKAVDRAVKETPGATGHTAKKNATTFTVTGNFNDQKFFDALQQEGLSGRVTTKAAPESANDSKSSKDH